MTTWQPWAAVAAGLLAVGPLAGCSVVGSAVSRPSEPVASTSSEPVASAAPAGLLRAAPGGDGDSWRDTDGTAYRLGMVDTPEVGDCFAAEATAERRRLVADGFRAEVYETDRYGRSVAVVTTADGLDLNVHLAREGFATDRYLASFASERPALAARLVPAFAAARAERKGLWGACRVP